MQELVAVAERFNTQPPEGGCNFAITQSIIQVMFQHTATRRWLHMALTTISYRSGVSTHSHPKVAAAILDNPSRDIIVSTHSHPKVAAERRLIILFESGVSTHSHPKVAASD